MVGIEAISGGGDVVPVNHKVNVILVEGLELGGVGGILDDLVHPLAGGHGVVPLVLRHGGGTLVPEDLGIRVNSHDQDIAHLLGLTDRVGVAKVHHVKAAIDPHSGVKKGARKTKNGGRGKMRAGQDTGDH